MNDYYFKIAIILLRHFKQVAQEIVDLTPSNKDNKALKQFLVIADTIEAFLRMTFPDLFVVKPVTP
jgi:hypothetical protein